MAEAHQFVDMPLDVLPGQGQPFRHLRDRGRSGLAQHLDDCA